MKNPFLILLLTSTLLAAGETRLLDGENLSGWSFESKEGAAAGAASWKLEGGVLSTTGTPFGFIRSRGSFENFTLTLEWRWLPGDTGRRNSGLFVNAGKTAPGQTWPPTIEIQLQHGSAGDLRMNGGATLEAAGEKKGGAWLRTADPHEKTIGEWNHLKVVSRNGTITVDVNGLPVNRGEKLSVPRGNICLQAEGAPIEFRKLVVEKLPSL